MNRFSLNARLILLAPMGLFAPAFGGGERPAPPQFPVVGGQQVPAPSTPRDRRSGEVRNPVVVTPAMPIGFAARAPYQIGSSVPPYVRVVEPARWVTVTSGCPISTGYGYWDWWDVRYPSSPYWGRTYYDTGPLSETRRYVDPSQAATPVAAAAAPSAPAAPPVDEGLESLRAREYERAIAIYERRDEEQRDLESKAEGSSRVDRSALRLLALAHAGAGDLDVAMEMLARAHAEDAGLSARTFDGVEVLGSRREMRRIVLDAIRFAKKSASGEAWEFAAILMEAEGRDAVAKQWRERWERERVTKEATPAAGRPAGPASYRMPADR